MIMLSIRPKGEVKKQQNALLVTQEMGLLYEKGNAKWPQVSFVLLTKNNKTSVLFVVVCFVLFY